MKKFLQTRIGIVIGIALIFYMFFIVGKTAYKNYQVSKQIEDLKKEIQNLEDENQEMRSKIVYYQTESFKEREARQKLGLQKPGEKVISVPSSNITPEPEEEKEEIKPSSEPNNFILWWNFFFRK